MTTNRNRFSSSRTARLARALSLTTTVAISSSVVAQPTVPPPATAASKVITPVAPVISAEPNGPVMTLAEALKRGRDHSPTIIIAHAQVDIARYREDSAAIPLRPTAALAASYAAGAADTYFAPATTTTGPITTNCAAVAGKCQLWPPYFLPTASVSAHWRLYDFGQVQAAVESAEASTHAAVVGVDSATNDLFENIELAYFQAVANKQLVAVAQSTLNSETRHVDEGQRLVNAGAQAEVGLAQIRAVQAAAQVTLVQAQNAADAALVALAQAIGDGQGVNFTIEDNWGNPVADEDSDTETLVKQAAVRNLSVIVQTANRDAAILALRSAERTSRPTIDSNAQVAAGGPETGLTTQFDDVQVSWTLSLSLSWTFADGGVRRAAVELALGNLKTAEANLAAAMLQLRTDVEYARIAVRAAKAQQVAVSSSLVAAKEALRLAEASFTAGAGTSTQLADAEVNVTTAAGQTVTADQQLANARAQLRHALSIADAGLKL